LYLSISNKMEENPDVYADLIVKYVSALIELSEYMEEFRISKEEMNNKILLLDTTICRNLPNGPRSYTYKYAYFKGTNNSYIRMTNKEYTGRKNTWEKALSTFLHCRELEVIIETIEKNMEKHIHTPAGQPSIVQIKQLITEQIQYMKNLYNKHKTTSKVEASPYIHNCLHEDGTKLISRAELLIYECIKKCGLQAIYEYLLVNEKTKTSMRPDFYGYRYAKPFIIEFFGMMGNADYKEKAIKKLHTYKTCGFELGENLIAFCAEKNADINMKTIHTVLKNFCVYGSLPKKIIYIDQAG